jgi:FkbM family methyltransferase
MIRDSLIDAAIRLRVDRPLMRTRATLTGSGRGYADEHRQLCDLLESTLSATSNCIDIGAYRGRVLAEMVRLAPLGHHIAYEPIPRMHRMLQRRFPEVDVRQAAVAERSGETTFTIVRDAPALSGLRDRFRTDGQHRIEPIRVRVESLDTDLPDGYVPHLLKVDVEGAELAVFEGALRTIATHKPTILFEHGKGGADHYNTTPADIHRVLTGVGLGIFDLDGRGPLTAMQFDDAFELNEQWNFVARP